MADEKTYTRHQVDEAYSRGYEAGYWDGKTTDLSHIEALKVMAPYRALPATPCDYCQRTDKRITRLLDELTEARDELEAARQERDKAYEERDKLHIESLKRP